MYLSAPGSTTVTFIMSRPWLGPCEVGTYLAPGGGVPDDGFDGDRARLGVADECCEGLDDAVVSSSPGGTVQAAAEGMEWF